MALTTTFDDGILNLVGSFAGAFSGDYTGAVNMDINEEIQWDASGGTAPTYSGFLHGETVTAAAGDWLLAHATDPFQSMGDAAYSTGFTVAGSKLKLLIVRASTSNSTNTITIARKSATGLPVFDTAGDSVTLSAGDMHVWYLQAGTAALSTGSNDGLTISVSGGSPTCEVWAVYGP